MMLAFGGTRTSHRLACGIEDAGFEIRDDIDSLGMRISWVHSQGMPKGINISKAIDRMRDDRDDAKQVGRWLREQREVAGLRQRDVAVHWPSATGGLTGCVANWELGTVPTWDQWLKLRELIGFGDDMDAEVWRLNGRKGAPGEAWDQREVVGQRTTGIGTGRGSVAYMGDSDNRDVTASATDEARQWEGWNTQLRPAHEPIIVARAPFPGTVAGNVLTHGTGAINVDATRVAADGRPLRVSHGVDTPGKSTYGSGAFGGGSHASGTTDQGRYPPNVVLSHVPSVDPATGEVVGDACAEGCVDGCPVRELTAQGGERSSWMAKTNRTIATTSDVYGKFGSNPVGPQNQYGDSGSAARFFPCFRFEAKAPTAERPRVAGESHSTVKPLKLMQWILRLVTPPGGIVLDCFAGTGVTGQAARAEGFQAVLIDSDPAAIPWIVARLDAHPREDKPTTAQPAAREAHPDLFDGEAP